MMENKIESLKRILEESSYTVAICGSGMMEEGGYLGVKFQERAYDIEEKYGVSPEDLFSSSYFNTRPEQFFRFYKNEMLHHMPEKTESWDALAAMQNAGKLQCVITANIFSMGKNVNLQNFIELHGSVYNNKCSRCGRLYPMEYVRDSKGIPVCESCNGMIRPQITLFGEMVDSRLITQVTDEVEKQIHYCFWELQSTPKYLVSMSVILTAENWWLFIREIIMKITKQIYPLLNNRKIYCHY